VHDGGEVQVLVGVDAADDLLVDAWDAEHRWLLPPEAGQGRHGARQTAADKTVTGPLARLS
jgi:hypothetical protein